MIKKVTYLLSAVLVFSLSTAAFATGEKKAEVHIIKGKITHIDGAASTYTITDEHGDKHNIHVGDTTQKSGNLTNGAQVEVEAESTSGGHANSIKVIPVQGEHH